MALQRVNSVARPVRFLEEISDRHVDRADRRRLSRIGVFDSNVKNGAFGVEQKEEKAFFPNGIRGVFHHRAFHVEMFDLEATDGTRLERFAAAVRRQILRAIEIDDEQSGGETPLDVFRQQLRVFAIDLQDFRQRRVGRREFEPAATQMNRTVLRAEQFEPLVEKLVRVFFHRVERKSQSADEIIGVQIRVEDGNLRQSIRRLFCADLPEESVRSTRRSRFRTSRSKSVADFSSGAFGICPNRSER